MKHFFIDNQDYNDAVYAMVEIELLFNALYPNQVDVKFLILCASSSKVISLLKEKWLFATKNFSGFLYLFWSN
ncbi:MAG: hypothetical protein HWD61_06050 [Parachlamydiaceae bacterium]|nr:MAG: hypothetical protein HWD61_06050 [Parachlamydiaceae bacterium]